MSECTRCGTETARSFAVVTGNHDLLPDGYYCDACTEAIHEFADSEVDR